MKTVSLFVWGSCFKTWIIHNHLGNLRWNVPPPYDQVSKVSGSRSRKGHRSHKLCCQPPLTPECLDAPAKSLGRIIKVYSSLRICHSPQSSLSPLLVSRQTQSRGDAGPRADHRVTRRQQNLWGQHWPIRGRRWGQVTNERPRPVRARCASGQESLRDWDKSRSGSGSVSSGPPTPADTDTESHEPCLNTWVQTQCWVQSRSIQDLWTASFPWWCIVTDKKLTNNK